MTQDAVLELCDANLAEATREMARWQEGTELCERGDWLLANGADPFPVGYANAAMALGAAAPREPEALLDAASAWFAPRARGYTVWVRRHLDADLAAACGARGLARISDAPGMVLDAPLREEPLPAGAKLAAVDGPEGARDFADVAARAYAGVGLPPAVTRRLLGRPERWLRPHVLAVVAYRHGRPAAGALAILSHGIAGLYWVGTVEEARRQGLGEACTRRVGNAAFERGAAWLTLQASRQGEPIYRRMGYREVTRYDWYLQAPPEAAAAPRRP